MSLRELSRARNVAANRFKTAVLNVYEQLGTPDGDARDISTYTREES